MADHRGNGFGSPARVGVLGVVWVLAGSTLAIAAGLDLQRQVAPVGAALSLVLALTLYLSRERSERRRKTLEAAEAQFLDQTLREAIHRLRIAVAEGSYREAGAEAPGSDFALTALILNYLETCCAGARRGLYDAALVQEFLGPLAQFMIEHFLVAPRAGDLPTRAFLPRGPAVDSAALAERDAPFPNLRGVFPALVAAARQRVGDYQPAPDAP